MEPGATVGLSSRVLHTAGRASWGTRRLFLHASRSRGDNLLSEEPRPSTASRPEPIATEMTARERAEAKRYGQIKLETSLMDIGLDLAVLAYIAVWLARPIDTWLRQSALLDHSQSLRLLVLFLIVTGLHAIVSFPLSFYAGYRVEHRFRLSTLSLGGWLWRYAKRLGLATALSMVLFLGLYWIIWTTGPWWWLVAAAAFLLVSVLLGQLAPVLILPLFYKIERLENPELTDRFRRLTEGTGLSIEGIYRMALSAETVKANAMLAGLGRTRRVLLGDTLLEKFTPEEIEVIFAHEVGHHVFRHMIKLLAAGVLYSALGFWLCDRLLAAWVESVQGVFAYPQLPVFALPMLMLLLMLFGVVVGPLQNAISRYYERQCDRYALDRTRLRAAYISAFRKLARLNKEDPEPSRMAIVLFYSHPPIAQRVAMADRKAR
jgi:STE24 endopeptidase